VGAAVRFAQLRIHVAERLAIGAAGGDLALRRRFLSPRRGLPASASRPNEKRLIVGAGLALSAKVPQSFCALRARAVPASSVWRESATRSRPAASKRGHQMVVAINKLIRWASVSTAVNALFKRQPRRQLQLRR
jgi:hypothetical protein